MLRSIPTSWRHALLPTGACALLCLAALWLYGDVFTHRGPFDRDELVWLRGDTLGSPWRWTQHWLLRDLGVPLFGPNRTGFQALALAIHVVGAALVMALVLQLYRAGRVGRGLSRSTVVVTALAAGLLYLAYDSGAPRWIAALSYELVVVTTLGALLGAARYRETGRLVWWGVAVGACALGLVTHIYAAGTPLLVAALEALLPRHGDSGRRWRRVTLRYATLLVPLIVFLAIYRDDLLGQGRAMDPGAGPGATAALAVEHLGLTVLRVWGGRPDLFRLDLVWGVWVAGASLLLLAIAGAGVWAMARRSQHPSVPALLLLFVLAPAAVTFAPNLAAPGTLGLGWRFALGGACLAVAAGGIWLALATAIATRLSPRSPAPVVLLLMPVLMVAVLLLLAPQGRAGASGWVQVIRGDARLFDQDLWHPDATCGRTLPRPPEDELRTPVDDPTDLICTDLASRDLAGFDLSQRSLGSADLTGADLAGSNLRQARLQRASLLWARLDGADLRGADLRGASLDGADLADADLRGASLEGASLHGAELRRADLRDLDLSQTDLTEADLAEARLDRTLLDPRSPSPSAR